MKLDALVFKFATKITYTTIVDEGVVNHTSEVRCFFSPFEFLFTNSHDKEIPCLKKSSYIYSILNESVGTNGLQRFFSGLRSSKN